MVYSLPFHGIMMGLTTIIRIQSLLNSLLYGQDSEFGRDCFVHIVKQRPSITIWMIKMCIPKMYIFGLNANTLGLLADHYLQAVPEYECPPTEEELNFSEQPAAQHCSLKWGWHSVV